MRAIVAAAIPATFKVQGIRLEPLRVAADAATTPYPSAAAVSAAKVYAHAQFAKEGISADYPFPPSFEAAVQWALVELVSVVAHAIVGFPVDIYWRV